MQSAVAIHSTVHWAALLHMRSALTFQVRATLQTRCLGEWGRATDWTAHTAGQKAQNSWLRRLACTARLEGAQTTWVSFSHCKAGSMQGSECTGETGLGRVGSALHRQDVSRLRSHGSASEIRALRQQIDNVYTCWETGAQRAAGSVPRRTLESDSRRV